MKTFILLTTVLVSTTSYADGSKDLKERVKALEERLSKFEKQFEKSELESTICLNEKETLQKELKNKEEDIKSCSAYLKFKGSHDKRNIGWSVVEILKGGCSGNAKIHTEKFRGEGKVEKTESDYEGLVVTKLANRGMPTLVVEKIQKKIPDAPGSPQMGSPYDTQIDLRFSDYHNQEFSSVILGKMYEISKTRSGGTLAKGLYTYKYNVVKGDNDALQVTMELERAEQWNHMPIGEKSHTRLVLTCKTLAQLNELGAKDPQIEVNQDIHKKVFGNQ